MTYTEILTEAWTQADDSVRPYNWNDTEWIGYLNTVMDELCIRTQLLVDSTDTDICRISATSGTASYSLHERIVNVLDVWDTDTGYPLDLYNVGQLNAYSTGWRALTGTPDKYALDDTLGKILFVPEPDDTFTIGLRVARLVKDPATADTLDDTPELPSKYHHFLINGLLYKAYEKNDAETRDPDKIAYHSKEWERALDLIYQAEKRYQNVERCISPLYGNI
jgi:hypothetical protein